MRKRGDIEEEPSTLMSVDSLPNECNSEDEQSSYHCIDRWPSYLISHCASWLHYKDYFHFGYCSRIIYCSLYTPSMIQQFELNYQSRRSCDNFSPLKNVTSLKMDILEFNELSSSDRATWRNNKSLTTLVLWNVFSGPYVDKEHEFLSNVHLINSDSVRRLTLNEIADELTVFKILSMFGQIEYLELTKTWCFNSLELAKWDDLKLCNLKHLKVEAHNYKELAGIDPLFKLVSKQKTVRKLMLCINDYKSYAALNEIEQSLKKHNAAVESLEELGIELGRKSRRTDKNEAFGKQICRIYKLWQSKASGLKMTINHGNIDVDNAGLSVLKRFSATGKRTKHDFGYGVTFEIVPGY